MHVLMIAGISEKGGAPLSLLEMVNTLHSCYGVEFAFIVNSEGKISRFCEENNISYIIAPHRGIAISRGSTLIRRIAKFFLRPYYTLRLFIENITAVKTIEQQLNINEIDLIHTNSNRDGIGALLSNRNGLPHIWHLREFGEEDYDTIFLKPYNYSFMKNNTTKFIAISDAVKESWIKKGILSDSIIRIYNGVDVKKIYSDSNRKALKSDHFQIVFVGTICPLKGQVELIKAIASMNIEEQKLFTVDFYGSYTFEYKRELQLLMKRNNIENLFTFRGFSDSLYKELQNYSIGIVCSKSEAFGRITPEYMAAGLIVIASDTGANTELINDGLDGMIYEYGNPESLKKKLLSVAKMTYSEKMRISKLAEKKARKHFTSDLNAENVYNMYLNICDMK